jgi:putative transposase
VRQVNGRWGQVKVPKVGWVRFRWSRPVPEAERRAARAATGSPAQQVERACVARLRAGEADRRKDWCEKTSTSLARRFDLIRFEDSEGHR